MSKPKNESSTEYVTTAEAQKILRRSAVTLYRMRRNRELAFYRIRDRILFLRSDLEEYMRRHRRE